MKIATSYRKLPHAIVSFSFSMALLGSIPANAQQSPFFLPGNLVVAVEGCGAHGSTCTNVINGSGNGSLHSSPGGYGDNQAAPLTLFQYAPNGTAAATFVNSLTLPQAPSGANLPVSGEYGSSSEATLQLSGGGQYLTLMGYGINAGIFDASPATYGAAPSNALAQSGSLTGQSYTPIARVVTLIDANGNVNSSTPLYNVFNTNNPRSIFTQNGTTAYVSGQGAGGDATSGVFYTPLFAPNTAPAPITGLDTTNDTASQDTRDVQIVNGTLYVSVDTKGGSNAARSYIGVLGTAGTLPTATVGGPTMLSGFGNSGGTGKVTITTGADSNGNGLNTGLQINISPVSFFFANAATVYVTDSGNPKNNSANSSLGNGGLEKWINSRSDGTGTWSLAYTLHNGLPLVVNSGSSGTTGLYGLAARVSGGTVQLYVTNYTLSDLDTTYLYGITDTLSFTTASQAASESFSLLDTAPLDSNFKGVSFAPVTPAGSVEITSSPSGVSFSSNGAGCAPGTYTTPQVLAWTPGNNCTLSVVSPQTYSGTRYVFNKWEGGSASTSRTVTAPLSTATYTANFLAVPVITWSAPGPVSYGTALSSAQLNAAANVPGTFTYSPAAGAVLPAGANTLSATFTPADTAQYATATAATSLTVNPANSGAANLVVTRTLTRSGANVIVQLTIANTGGTAAANVVLTNVKVGADIATPLPQNLGTIAAGASVQVSVTVPASVGTPGAASSLAVSGTYSGGTFSSSSRITLP